MQKAEFAVAKGIDHESASNWWVKHVLKKRDRIIVSIRRWHTRGHQFSQYHMVFDIKMEDFRCKTRLVVGGHMTKASANIMYDSIVSRETVRINFDDCHPQ